MVQFNPKRTNSPFSAVHQRTALTVMIVASKVLFEAKLENPKKNSLYVHIRSEEGKIPYRQTATDVAYRIIGQMKTEGYNLMIDDTRLPTDTEAKNPGTCIVARSVEDAIKVVEKLGCPKHLFLDYSLDIYGDKTIMSFLDWFVEKYTKESDKVHKDFGHTVISQHPEGPRLIERKLIEFYDHIWS